ncbi:bacterial regulatory protein, tetR family [Oxobacter pfennigii]|uniref:Bacterial regulatory protein, tetR family n=1 Tax=Oxobacter pfennigii TaxID=36849 RepID=A0A0P8W5M3_9CLOT|nr:TetR/AcrR family transcriptional regulator [Oxobacter pfennigii]KPU43249.1 bacterial regulatory protein, tetR family [Oxobacter pfennigii]
MNGHSRQKTRNQIEEWMMSALLLLMKEKPFREIKITEVVDRAQLARCTFYRYYKSKEELLMRCCESIFEELAASMFMGDHHTFYRTALAYFSFWLEHREFFDLLQESNMLYFFMQSHDELMFRVAKEVKPENAEKGGFDFSPKVRYHFFFGMGGFWGMANRWLLHGCKESPEELAQYVVAYLVESYELEPGCQYYDKHKAYPYAPCYIRLENEF